MSKEAYTEINQEYVWNLVDAAKKVFCNGVYVKCKEHPCGWDFINFEDCELEVEDDAMEQPIDISAISNGIYNYHPFDGLTLYEIIKEVGMKGWCFEISGTLNW
jgi:hypothetical protein